MRDQVGVPATARNLPLPPGPGNGRTYTSWRPDSSEEYASHRPSGENIGSASATGCSGTPSASQASSPERRLRPSAGSSRRLGCRFSLRRPATLPLGCHEPGICEFLLSVRRGVASLVGALPPQVQRRLVRARRCERDPAAVGGPTGLVRRHGSDVSRLSVSRALVDPDVGCSLADLHGEAAIGREDGIEPVRGRDSQRRRLSLPIHPVERYAGAEALSRPIDQRAVRGDGELRASRCAFDVTPSSAGTARRSPRAVEIERRREERSIVDVDEMAACASRRGRARRQIPAVIAAATGRPSASPPGNGCTMMFASL